MTTIPRRSALALVACATLAGCAGVRAAGKPPTLAEVIRRNTLARGGAAALDRVHSVSMALRIEEGGHSLDGRYAAADSGLVRIDIYSDGKPVFSEGIDSAGGWLWNGKEIKASVASGVEALRIGADNHLFGWHRFADRGHRLTLMPSEAIDGAAYRVIEIAYASGLRTYFYLDPVSWLVVRKRDDRAYHPDVEPTKQKVESRFFDFRTVDGVVASHLDHDYDLATGNLLATHRVLDRKLNPGLPPGHFDRYRRA